MNPNLKDTDKKKNLFKSYYCAGCRQRKVCGMLTDWDSDWKSYCCHCYYQSEKKRAKEYSDYQQVYQQKEQEKKAYIQRYQLLRSYRGCPKCRSLTVDAYHLYNENKLICQPCRMRKKGGSSGPISFLEQSKWYKKRWGINLSEWLENYGCLPVNADCAREWLKDKEHLPKNCSCLAEKAKELYELFANSLKKTKEKLKECQCETSKKVRVNYLDSEGSGWIYCEKCKEKIESAGHHGVIKNRNDPKFWGLKIKKRVLCGFCLGNLIEKMPRRKKYLFWEYGKRGYWV